MDSPASQLPGARSAQRKSRLKGQRIPPPGVQSSHTSGPVMYGNNPGYNEQPVRQYGQPTYTTNNLPSQSQGFAQQSVGQQQNAMMFNPSDSHDYVGQQIFNDPMASMAVQYGQKLAGQGTDIVTQKIEGYVSTSNLKYYFAVDTTYVWRKLQILLFPFVHTDWSIQYNQEEPVAPRYEVNAPDLYIPVMAFVTFVLTTGVVLGTHNRFSPEQLGIQASSSLGWLIIEILAILFTLYLMNISTNLKYLDLIAFCGYKYVGMILSLLAGLVTNMLGYYLVLLWTSGAVAFFLVQTLRVKVLPHSDDVVTHGTKRRNYLLLTVAGIQPILMWWLTGRIMFGN